MQQTALTQKAQIKRKKEQTRTKKNNDIENWHELVSKRVYQQRQKRLHKCVLLLFGSNDAGISWNLAIKPFRLFTFISSWSRKVSIEAQFEQLVINKWHYSLVRCAPDLEWSGFKPSSVVPPLYFIQSVSLHPGAMINNSRRIHWWGIILWPKSVLFS